MSVPYFMRGGVVLTPRDLEGYLFFGRDQTNALGQVRKFIAIDTETYAGDFGEYPVQPLVCLQVYDPDVGQPEVLLAKYAPARFREIAAKCFAEDITIVLHNASYDIAVLCAYDKTLWPLMWQLLDAGLIEDTILVEKLDALARGDMDEDSVFKRWVDLRGKRANIGYSLAACVDYRLGISLEKGEETWRTRYGELDGVPVEQWPADAYKYAADDPYYTWALRTAQEQAEAASPAYPGQYAFADAPAQTRAAWALFLCRWVGVRTDALHVPVVRKQIEERINRHYAGLIESGMLEPERIRPKKGDTVPPKRNMARIKELVVAAFAAQGMEPPCTEETTKVRKKGKKAGEEYTSGGAIKTDAVTLDIGGLHDERLIALKEYMSGAKLLAFLTSLSLGFDKPIHTDPNVLVATGRTSWGSTSPDGIADDAKSINLQNLPKYPGIRESYIPPPGMLMFAIDYSQLELCALSYVCRSLVGFSRMGDLIDQKIDLHSTLAASFLGVTYEDFLFGIENGDIATKEMYEAIRQLAKAANFGFPGGMGVKKFIFTTRKQSDKETLKKINHLLDEATVKRLKDTWFKTFPEMRKYFSITKTLAGQGQMVQLSSGRIRGGIDFCSCSNSFFQGLAADGAKEALYLIQREMFSDPDSPLYGGHVFAFIHDEFVGCVLAERAAAAVDRCYEIAMAVMRARMPGINIEGSKCLTTRWRKKAKAEYQNGVLVPFETGKKYRELLKAGKIWDDTLVRPAA